MSEKRIAPAGNRGESDNQVGTGSKPSLAAIHPLPPITAVPVATFPDGETIDLLALTQGCENPRYEVYLQGWARGYQSRQPEIDRLRWERDLFYFCFANKKRPGDFYTHLTNELWNEAAK